MKYNDLKKAFQKPEAMDRSAPFWSWNARMNPEEVKRQAHDMIEKGMGGYFMHSRVGLESEYLGEEWMDSVRACVEQAAEDGTFAWLYDEDRWPSGAAGGLVTCIKENGGKGLSAHISDSRHMDGEVLFSYEVDIIGDTLSSYRLLGADEKSGTGRYLHIRLDYLPPLGWFNNTPPADNINSNTVKKFIETSYEPYRERFGNHFGKEIPGIFTDEPNIASSTNDYGDGHVHFAYTYDFPVFFNERRGYDFSTVIPALFYENNLSKKARHDYFRTLGQMFAENFSKQLYEWCEENNLLFTGHWLAENRMGSYILLSGGLMLNYLYQHIPGIDMLRDQTIEFMTIKGCTSVANQTGRKRSLTETYGVSGWQFSFEGQKWIGDYQYIQGINLRCQHLAWYSMKGCRKRDYPPLFNYQTPWWKYNNTVEDYFARIGALTSKGTPAISTLLLHPLSTAWINIKIDHNDPVHKRMQEKTDELGFMLNDYTRNLMANHIDFDYGDEEIMAMMARIENGRLVIGEMEYTTVVIPPFMENMYGSTISLLKRFMDGGGRVICEAGDIRYIEGEDSDAFRVISSHGNFIRTDSIRETAAGIQREVSIMLPDGNEAGRLFSMVRDYEGTRLLYVINNDKTSSYETEISLKGIGRLEEWDPLTGEIIEYPSSAKGLCTCFNTFFGPTDSKIFVLDTERPVTDAKIVKREYRFLAGLGSACDFERTDDNVLVLDMCSFDYDGEGFGETDEIWKLQRSLREKLGMEPVYDNRGPQRYKWIYDAHENDGRKLRIRFEFIVESVPEKAFLVVEDIDNYDVKLNGTRIGKVSAGWFLDRDFGRIELPGLTEGINEIILECSYVSSTELENIYVTGDFGVSVSRTITREPQKLVTGDWGLQGYFFYHAGIKYKYLFDYKDSMGKNIMMDLGAYNDVVTIVRINGHETIVPWKARSKVDIGHMLNPGTNEIEIEVMGAPRNMFGPHHLTDSREKWTNATAFHPEDDRYTEQYIMYPWGLMEQVCIYSY